MMPGKNVTRRSPTNILLVDAHSDIREVLSDMLRHEGYRVKAVGSGAEGLRQVMQDHYEAALLDIRLPDLDGPSVLRVMRELDPSLPIIVLTGYTTVESTMKTRVKNAFAHLTKPYNQEEIKTILSRAVGVNRLAETGEQV
ncbi:MAG: response regulator [Nitrospirae bacterium]|nr:MAG: response regulator [Nitrospirota bacterium]